MDRRQHINSSLSKTSSIESIKQKTTNGNAMNNNHQHIGYRRNSSSIDSTASANYRKSFPTTLDNSLNNSIQDDHVNNNNNNNNNNNSNNSQHSHSHTGSINTNLSNSQYGLTQAGLEEYSRSYYEQNLMYNHQKQSSYAQSEGYHSYVSSSDSTSTPFLDRLRQDSQLLQSRAINWSQEFQTQNNLNSSTNSISSTSNNNNNINNNNINNNNSNLNNNIKGNNSNSGSTNDCSESTSSSETLKWLGSMSDVSVASQATNTSTLSASSQLIVHSSKVRTPQRHNSESVLYMNDEQKICTSNSTEDLMSESSYQQRQFQQRSSDRSNRSDNRLFPINTYTEQPASLNTSTTSLDAKLLSNHNWQSVADRINELEKQQQQQSIHDHNKQQFTYLDPNKTHRISNPTLKAFQKNAIQSYFERQQQQTAKINKPSNNSDDMSKSKSICGELASANSSSCNNNSNNNYNSASASGRPQSLNLSIVTQLPMNMQTPSSSSSSASQRSSISGWPSSVPSSASSTMASPTAAFINGCNNNNNNNNNMMMMKNNANVDITKMNMKNNAISSMLGEKQLLAGMKMNKNQSIVNNGNNMNSRNMFTSFCEIKTEKYSSLDAITSSTDNINHSGLNSMTPPPPPPRSKSLMPVRRTSSASEYSSIRDKMLHQKQHLSKDLLGPMIMGQIISVDDWVPERPPKTSALRVPSPELPPPPVTNVEHLSSNQDDPLPPPPPELLRQQMKLPDMNDVKLNPASRRNSFAGQSNVPPHVNNMPPAIPMRPKLTPNPIMTVSMNEGLHRRPSSGMDIVKNVCQMPQEQTVHAQRIMVVPKMDDHQSYVKPQQQMQQQRQQASPQTAATRNVTDSRVSQRKRTHNSKDCTIYATPIQPPPLKPRMRNQNENSNASGNNVFAPITTKTRSTSKASYLPRQPREKLLDPDHGSYKLTLHELSDNVNGEFQEDLQKCNLPDVLPVGVKYHNPSRHPHHHPQQRPPHHFSQHFTPQPHYHPTETHLTPQTAPILSSNALKSIFHFQMSNPGTPTSSSNPSNPSSPSVQSSTSSSPLIPSSPFNGSTHKLSPNTSPIALLQSPKYTSQSSIDMKKTQVLDPKLYTNEELIKTYREQKEACRELNKNILNNYEKSLLSTPQPVTECDKIAVVRKLNMVESPVILSPVKSFENLNSSKINNKSTESLKSLEEKATNEKSEKDIIIENEDKAAREGSILRSPIHTPTLSISPFESEFSEALNNIQRTEIIVRVNPVIKTQETASQTEEDSDNNSDSLVTSVDEVSEVKVSPWTTPVRQKYPEEVDCEKLSKDLVSQLSPSDKLHHILAPKTYKSSSDYISDLFKINVTSRPTKKDVSTSTLEKSTINSSMEILTPNSVYFSTSEPKAKLMTRYSREMTLVNGDSSDLTKKKEELVTRLGKKLVVLTNEQTMLVDESTANDVLGNDVALKVAQKVRPGDSTKFRSYVDDVGYITMLLLSLSGRLARTENALHSIGEKTADKKILEAKRDRLLEQLEEAKHLKEDIDRRGSIIASILENALTTEEYADYDYFINMKAKLIVDSREIADKIKLGEEQLNSLKDTLVQSEC